MLDHTDRSLAKSAIDKIKLGQTPSVREARALKSAEKDKEETRRWEYYRSVPSKHYKEMSGRSARVLIDQQQRWNIPCAGKTVDLPILLKAFHDFIANYTHRTGDESEGTGLSKALERLRTAAAEKTEMEVAATRGEFVPLIEVKALVGENCARLIRMLGIVENIIGTEFALWLVDPKVQAMPAEERARMVREFVARTCHEVRAREAQDVRELVAEIRRAAGEADDGSTLPAANQPPHCDAPTKDSP